MSRLILTCFFQGYSWPIYLGWGQRWEKFEVFLLQLPKYPGQQSSGYAVWEMYCNTKTKTTKNLSMDPKECMLDFLRALCEKLSFLSCKQTSQPRTIMRRNICSQSLISAPFPLNLQFSNGVLWWRRSCQGQCTSTTLCRLGCKSWAVYLFFYFSLCLLKM